MGKQDFETDVRKLAHMAYSSAPTVVIEQMAMQNFVGGIKHGTARIALLLTTYSTTREALDRGLGVVAAYKATAATWGQ